MLRGMLGDVDINRLFGKLQYCVGNSNSPINDEDI